MKKSTLLMIVSVVLALTLSLGSTLAYLQDSDSDVNVMTLGNVYIEQLEYERVVDEDGEWVAATGDWLTDGKDQYGRTPDLLQEFEQNKPLYPAVYANDKNTMIWDDRDDHGINDEWRQSWGQIGASGANVLFDDSVKNVVDKFVFVENTGKSDAYFRTIFAFELADGWTVADVRDDKMIHTNVNANQYQWDWLENPVEIDGDNYAIAIASYMGPSTNANGILAKETVSYPSLLQVYLDPKAGNKDIESLGDTYEVLVLSQAVQTAGFDANGTYTDGIAALNEAFGEVGAANKDNADLLNVQVWMGEFYPTITVTDAA